MTITRLDLVKMKLANLADRFICSWRGHRAVIVSWEESPDGAVIRRQWYCKVCRRGLKT